MAEVKWIKLSTEVFCDSGKITQIEAMPEGDTLVVIWFKLLILAGKVNDGGAIYLTPEIPYTDEMLANAFRKPINTVRMAMQIFEKFGMIEIVDDILYLSSWEKYQNTDKLAEIREQNRERKRLQRAREKQALLDVSRDSHVTSHQCHDIEEEKEEDKEKEIHSFVHSCESEEVKLKYMGGTLGQGVVLISDEQFSDLCDKLSIDEIDKYMGIIVECEKNGKCYKKKSHYQAILDMAQKDRRVSK